MNGWMDEKNKILFPYVFRLEKVSDSLRELNHL
jgi:hypothetical protein